MQDRRDRDCGHNKTILVCVWWFVCESRRWACTFPASLVRSALTRPGWRNIRLCHAGKSVVVEHSIKLGHRSHLLNAQIHGPHHELHRHSMKRKDSCCLTKSREPLIYSPNEAGSLLKINCYLVSLNLVLIWTLKSFYLQQPVLGVFLPFLFCVTLRSFYCIFSDISLLRTSVYSCFVCDVITLI
jgi:hypothetical protein